METDFGQDDKPEDEEQTETEAVARQGEQQGKGEVRACTRGPCCYSLAISVLLDLDSS